ncbi:MAG TPA: hypothetical protein VL978_15030 [Puia sp.]|nr:hypothetical protein [Puia sp.]
MPTVGHITHLRRHEIDTTRWDRCIEASVSPMIYGSSFYLDTMAAGKWDALMLDDYRAVMPLTWRSKFGIRYLYQPAFTQQTGIFSPEAAGPALVETFLRQLESRFRFAEIFLNYANPHPALSPRTNFILHLGLPYEQISGRYRKDLARNLRLSGRRRLTYIKDFDLHTALHDFRHEYALRLPSVKGEDYLHFETLCLRLREKDQLLTRAVLNEKQQPLCSAVFLRDARRFYLVHSTTLPAGRAAEANHFLLDRFIREWAGFPMILDFEGSDHPGIAHFYRNFGATDQPYFFYRHNRLPWPIRWLK